MTARPHSFADRHGVSGASLYLALSTDDAIAHAKESHAEASFPK